MLEFVDTHVHFYDVATGWYPSFAAAAGGEEPEPEPGGEVPSFLRHTSPSYDLADYRRNTASLAVGKLVHVAAAQSPAGFLAETGWVDAIATRHGGVPQAIVGRVDPAEAIGSLEHQLEAHARSARLRGVRLMAADDYREPALGRLLDLLADRRLVCDMFMHPGTIGAATAAALAQPEVTVVLEHLGWPLRTPRDHLDAWRRDIAHAATAPNLVCKISGLGLVLPSLDDPLAKTLIGHCLEQFGPRRCMIGTNLPVDRHLGSASEIADTVVATLGPASPDERHAVLVGTAESVYRI